MAQLRQAAWNTLIVLFALLAGGQVWAQDPSENDSAEAPEVEQDGRDEDRPGVQETGDRRLMAQVKRLQREMDDKLELSVEQRKAVHQLFDEYLREIRADKAAAAGKADDDTEERMAELREQLEEARKAKDQATLQQVRVEMRDLLKKKRAATTAASREFIEQVEEELDEEQTAGFRELVRELGLEPTESGATMQQLMRALMQPDVALTGEQKAMVRERMREAMTAMSTDEQAAADMSGAATRMKADILEELTPAQRKKVEAHLSEYAETPGQLKPALKKGQQRERPSESDEEAPDE